MDPCYAARVPPTARELQQLDPTRAHGAYILCDGLDCCTFYSVLCNMNTFCARSSPKLWSQLLPRLRPPPPPPALFALPRVLVEIGEPSRALEVSRMKLSLQQSTLHKLPCECRDCDACCLFALGCRLGWIYRRVELPSSSLPPQQNPRDVFHQSLKR